MKIKWYDSKRPILGFSPKSKMDELACFLLRDRERDPNAPPREEIDLSFIENESGWHMDEDGNMTYSCTINLDKVPKRRKRNKTK